MNRLFFIWQAIVGTWLFLAGFTAAAQHPKADTTFTVRFPAQTMQVTVPVRYIEVPKIDTVYIYQCPPVAFDMKWSEYKGSFQQFINEATAADMVARIDKDVTPVTTVKVPSGARIVADSGVVIRNINKILFDLSGAVATQYFGNLSIVQDSIGTAFHRITTGVTYYDTLYNVKVVGGLMGYESSRGGTANKMAVTAMRKCYFENEYINLSVFAQDGPYRALHLHDVQLKTKTSHNIYVHPGVSLDYYAVISIDAGKLMQHQYSANGLRKLLDKSYNAAGASEYFTARYSVFRMVNSRRKGFEMTSLADGKPVVIENSILAPYVTGGVPPALVQATMTQFVNGGNGIFLSGTIDSCLGGVWSFAGYPLTIRNSQLSEFSYRGGGDVLIENSKIANVWGADRGAAFNIVLRNTAVGTLYDGGNGNGSIALQNTTIQSKPTVRPDIIK